MGPAIPKPRTTAMAIDIPYRAIARPFRSAVDASEIRDIVLGPTRPPPKPWLARTRASWSGLPASAYRNRLTPSQSSPIVSGRLRPHRSTTRPNRRFAGAWTAEYRPTMIPTWMRSAPREAAYRAMIGTSAFVSIVPSTVATRTFRVWDRSTAGGPGRGAIRRCADEVILTPLM